MRIEKTIKGEKIPFKVNLIPKTMTAEVRFLMGDEAVIGVISEDFNYITLPENYLSPYISNVGRIKVGRLKLNKSVRFDAIELNT